MHGAAVRNGERAPVGHRHILNPAQINRIVNMILPIDVRGLDREDEFENGRSGGHRKVGEDGPNLGQRTWLVYPEGK